MTFQPTEVQGLDWLVEPWSQQHCMVITQKIFWNERMGDIADLFRGDGRVILSLRGMLQHVRIRTFAVYQSPSHWAGIQTVGPEPQRLWVNAAEGDDAVASSVLSRSHAVSHQYSVVKSGRMERRSRG